MKVRSNIKYRNLYAEMKGGGVTFGALSNFMGYARQTMYKKIVSGDIRMDVDDAAKIAAYMAEKTGKDMSVEYLFKTGE